MSYQNLSPQELLGPLNEVEQKNVPKTLYVAGDTGILGEGARVAIVGSRKARGYRGHGSPHEISVSAREES